MKNKLKNIIPYAGLILVFLLFVVLTSGRILNAKNIKMIVEQSILVIISSIGVVFVMSLGSLDFSQGSMLGIGSIVAAKLSYVSIPLAVAATILVCTAIGALNGFLHVRLRIPSFIVTMCMMFVFRGLTSYLTRESALQVSFKIYDLDNFTLKLIVTVALVFVGFYIFHFTYFGRQAKAIGAGEIAARYSAVSVDKMKILVFALAGLTGGICAFMNIVRVGTATANTGSLHETDVLVALVLGGMSVTGGARSRYSSVVVGGVMLAVLANGLVMLGVGIAQQQLIKGVIFMAAVALTAGKSKGVTVK